jgi:hypothetical protein
MQTANTTTDEIWKDIKGYEGLYQVSNYGNIKSVKRTVPHAARRTISKKEKIMTLKKTHKGYYSIQLYKAGKRKGYAVHRLVAMHFLINKENYETVDHIDANKKNNHYTNLEWVTNAENSRRKVEKRLHIFGERIYTNKLKEKDVLHIRREFWLNSDNYNQKVETYNKLVSGYGVCRGTIKEICQNKIWKHLL